MSLASDEILLELMPKCGGLSRVIALSKLVDEPRSSNVTDQAVSIRGRVHSDIESIVKYKPDLVIAASFNRQDVIDALKKRGIRILTLDQFSTIEDIAGNILKIGAFTNCEDPAQKLHESLMSRVNAVIHQASTHPLKLTLSNYSADLVIMGKNTLFNDIISKAGALNAAAILGFEAWPKLDAETLLKMNPDYLVILDDDSPSLRQTIKSHHIWKRLKAVQNERFIFLKPKDAFSTSHYIIVALESMANALMSRAGGVKK